MLFPFCVECSLKDGRMCFTRFIFRKIERLIIESQSMEKIKMYGEERGNFPLGSGRQPRHASDLSDQLHERVEELPGFVQVRFIIRYSRISLENFIVKTCQKVFFTHNQIRFKDSL